MPSVRSTVPIDMKKPKVAADGSMICENVPSTPLGPGPARRIWIEAPMKPMVRPTSVPVIAPILTVDTQWISVRMMYN